jgi:hypothetical protein
MNSAADFYRMKNTVKRYREGHRTCNCMENFEMPSPSKRPQYSEYMWFEEPGWTSVEKNPFGKLPATLYFTAAPLGKFSKFWLRLVHS